MTILARTYLVLAILFGIAGVVQCVRWSEFGTITVAYLLNFLPMTAFLLAYIAGSKMPRKATHVVVIPLCLAALASWGFLALSVEVFISATAEVTDAGRYDDILEDHWGYDQELVHHFPRPIPSDAQNVRFSFLPSFLQGGAHVQLRYSLPPDAISAVYNRFSKEKTMSFHGGDMTAHMNMPEGMPTTCFYTSDSGDHEFPDDFEIMIFDKVLKEEDRPEGFYWNHGRSHGIAISKTRNEVVYWAEAW